MAGKKAINNDTWVDIMNNTTGTFYYKNSRTQAEWTLEGYGAIDQMQVSDLMNMRSSQKRCIDEAWCIILDDDVVTHLRLDKLYENILKPEDVENLFNSPEDKIIDVLKKAPSGMKLLVAQKAKEMIKSGELDSRSKQKAIEDALSVKLIDELMEN